MLCGMVISSESACWYYLGWVLIVTAVAVQTDGLTCCSPVLPVISGFSVFSFAVTCRRTSEMPTWASCQAYEFVNSSSVVTYFDDSSLFSSMMMSTWITTWFPFGAYFLFALFKNFLYWGHIWQHSRLTSTSTLRDQFCRKLLGFSVVDHF